MHEKTNNFGFRPGPTQTCLYNLRSRLETRNFGFKKKRYCTIYGAKTKALISRAALFSHMQIVGFSHAKAQMCLTIYYFCRAANKYVYLKLISK